MKRFRFRLQRVMDARVTIERQRQRDMAEAQGELADQQKKLKELEAELEETERDQRNMVQRPVKAGDALIQHRWHRELRTRIRVQQEQVAKAATKVEEARVRLVEASKDRKVLEKLKERRLEEYHKEELTQQQNQLDDVGARRSAIGSMPPADRG